MDPLTLLLATPAVVLVLAGLAGAVVPVLPGPLMVFLGLGAVAKVALSSHDRDLRPGLAGVRANRGEGGKVLYCEDAEARGFRVSTRPFLRSVQAGGSGDGEEAMVQV